MATGTYTALAETTLTSTASSVTFSSIPTTDANGNSLRDLVLVTNMYANQINEGFVILNGSSSGFTAVRMLGYSSGAISGTYTTNNLVPTQTSPSAYKLQFLDFSATDKHKIILMNHGRADDVTASYAARWASTSAITSIKIQTTSPYVFVAGATFALYGIAG